MHFFNLLYLEFNLIFQGCQITVYMTVIRQYNYNVSIIIAKIEWIIILVKRYISKIIRNCGIISKYITYTVSVSELRNTIFVVCGKRS